MSVNIYRGDLQCCRVCLATDIKLISLDHPLKQTYSEFSGVPIMSTDGLPQHICEFCLAMLEKSMEFQRKCKSTYNLLARQLLDLHALTTSYIKMLDRSNLRPPLTISDIWQCDCLPDEEICMSDKETADGLDNDLDNGFGHEDTKSEEEPLDDNKNEPEHVIDDEIETQKDSLNIDKNILNEDEKRIEEFKVKHNMYTLTHPDKQLFYQHILEKYLTKSKKHMHSDLTKITFNIDVKDYKLTIHADLDNANETCNNTQNESQKKLYEYINIKYKERHTTIRMKRKKLREIIFSKNRVKEIKMRKGSLTTKSLAKLSKDCNFDVILMRKEDIIKELLEKRESKHNNKKFRCELCFMGFVTENTLQNHMTIHDKSLPYSCEYCHVGFKQSWKLKGHVARMHRYKFICRQCGQVKLNTSDVRQHHRSHSGDRYLCEHCGKTFNIYKSRMEHIRIHHGSVACDICHIKFATKAGLVIHKTKTHRELFKCPVCLVQFHSANALKIHTEVTARACGEHIRPCTRCGSSFDSKEALTRHIFDEHPPNIGGSGNYRGPIRRRPKSPKSPKPGKLECSVCSVGGFQNESALRYHKQRFHTNFICDYCNKGFQKKQAMALHIRTAHLGERPYTCRHSGCGRTFKHLSGHLSHLRTHSDERPFICDHCSFAFKSKQMMEKHISTIHLGERRYSCPRAGCGRAFKQHHHLVNHLRSHSDEKSFSCDSCPKIFKYSASLYEHRKIVHEGKPGRKRNHR